MKLLIGGKSRNIYMRKDGSAYYKSGGEKVDASYMFKKNGDLKKQYSENVKETHRIKKNKKFYGGANSIQFTFKSINFNSDSAGNKRKELLKLLQIAYNVVLERRIYRDEDYNNTIVDKDYNNFLINLLYVLQYYELKKKTNIGTLKTRIKALEKGDDSVKTYLNYYTQIKQLFTPLSPEESNKDTDILRKLHSLTDTLFIRTETTDSVIDTMFDNIKNIIDEVSVQTPVVSNSALVYSNPDENMLEPISTQETKLDQELKEEQSQQQQERQKQEEQDRQKQQERRQLEQLEQQRQLEQQQLEQKQQLKQQQQQLEQKQKQQLKQQQQQLEQKQKQIEQLKIIQRSALALTSEFLQQYNLDPKDYFNSLDSIIKRKIELMKFIKQDINSIQSIFITNQSKHLGNERQIMQVVLIAEQIVVRIKKNVKEGLYTKIQELKDAKQISIPQYNQNMKSTKQLLEIIEDTFKKIESIISKSN